MDLVNNISKAKFAGINWTVYNTSNSELPDNNVTALALDGLGNKWIGTGDQSVGPGRLAKFDGTNWTVYSSSNSGLPYNFITSLAVDDLENKWIGVGNWGLVHFDDINWILYSTFNSGLPSNYIKSIVIDYPGNKWLGTFLGLAIYNEGGVVSVENAENIKSEIVKAFMLYQNYPNPFNPITKIKYTIPSVIATPLERGKQSQFVTLKVYDILGKEVAILVNEEKSAGTYEVDFDGFGLTSGIYFYTFKACDFSNTKKMILLK